MTLQQPEPAQEQTLEALTKGLAEAQRTVGELLLRNMTLENDNKALRSQNSHLRSQWKQEHELREEHLREHRRELKALKEARPIACLPESLIIEFPRYARSPFETINPQFFSCFSLVRGGHTWITAHTPRTEEATERLRELSPALIEALSLLHYAPGRKPRE